MTRLTLALTLGVLLISAQWIHPVPAQETLDTALDEDSTDDVEVPTSQEETETVINEGGEDFEQNDRDKNEVLSDELVDSRRRDEVDVDQKDIENEIDRLQTTNDLDIGAEFRTNEDKMDPIHWLPDPLQLRSCDGGAPGGRCDISAWERCVPIRGRERRCDCIAGHARASSGLCVAIKPYAGHIVTSRMVSSAQLQVGTSQYHRLLYEVHEALLHVVRSSRLRSILVKLNLHTLGKTPSGLLAVKFDLVLSRSYAPPAVHVGEDLRMGLRDALETTGGVGSEVELVLQDFHQLNIEAPDPCSSPLLNFCSRHATCRASTQSFTCSCIARYRDDSPNQPEAPGEVCTLDCGCQNSGLCEIAKDDELVCRCPSWFLGPHCEVDGKILLICISVVLGLIFLIGLVCCACCIHTIKNRQSRQSPDMETHSHTTHTPHDHKDPWRDSWRYFRYSPPPYPGYPSLRGYAGPHMHPPYGLAEQPVYRVTPRTLQDSRLRQQVAAEFYPYNVTLPRPQIETKASGRGPHHDPWRWTMARGRY